VPQPTKTWYGGRFRLDLPVGLTSRGQEAYVKGVELRGVTLPPAPTSAAARDAYWKQHVAEVREEYRSHKLPPILDEGTLRPGVPKLSYRGYDEDDLVLEALLTDERRAVLVIALWRQSYKLEQRPAQNAEREHAFNEVVNAFSFLPEGPVIGNADAFHVAGGVVRLPYPASDVDHPERLGMGFDGPTHWLKFDIEYVFIKERSDDDKRPGILQRVAHTVAEWPIVGHYIRSGRRAVAGFSGEESILRSKDDHTVRCGWMYEPAKDLAGFQPTIKISAESDDGDVGLTTDFWDQALVGIRRLGS